MSAMPIRSGIIDTMAGDRQSFIDVRQKAPAPSSAWWSAIERLPADFRATRLFEGIGCEHGGRHLRLIVALMSAGLMTIVMSAMPTGLSAKNGQNSLAYACCSPHFDGTPCFCQRRVRRSLTYVKFWRYH